MIQAIFFDFNGVIINDERLQMSAYQRVFRGYGFELTEEQYFAALGMDDKNLVVAAFARVGQRLTRDTLRTILQAKAEIHRQAIEDELPLFPGVVTFLKATSRHYSLGLVSMAGREEIDYVVDRANLRSLFSVMVTAEDVTRCKPASDCYQQGYEKLNEQRRALRQLPLISQECLIVEDSPPGILSGLGAGMRTLAVTNTVSERELRNAGAEVVTASLADWTVDSVQHVFS